MSAARKFQHKRNGNQPCAIDLFSGCGGLSLGLKQAGFRILNAVEIDELAVRTYEANHKDVKVLHSDIRDLDADKLRKKLKLRKGELDLLAGCPPCQGFSTLRTRNGASRNRDARNNLVQEMLRFAQEFLPKAVMMENVPRLIGRKPFAEFCEGLTKLGYKISFDVKDASRYGVPQRRKRLILLASLGFDIRFAAEARYSRTVRDTIGSLAAPGGRRDRLHSIPETKRSDKVQELIRDIPKDGGSRGDLPHERQLECHKKSDGFRDVYGRMSWDRVAPTITSGCLNPSKGRFLHPQEDRVITVREAALLQGFPSRYFFDLSGGREAAALMIGNALPPEFIRRHALEIQKSLTRHAANRD